MSLTQAIFQSVGRALTEAHIAALRTRRTMYVFAFVSDPGHDEARYVVRDRPVHPRALPVARVDAYIEDHHAFTCTDGPEYRAPLED